MELYTLYRIPENHPAFNLIRFKGFYTLTQLDYSSLNYAILFGYITSLIEHKQSAVNSQIFLSQIFRFLYKYNQIRTLFQNLRSGQDQRYFSNIDLVQFKAEILNLSEELFDKSLNENMKYGKFSQEFNCKISVFQENAERVYDFGSFGNPVCVNVFFDRFGGEFNYFYLTFRDGNRVEKETRPCKSGIVKRLIGVIKKILAKRNQEFERNLLALRKDPVSNGLGSGGLDGYKRVLPGMALNRSESEKFSERKSVLVQNSEKRVLVQHPDETRTLPTKVSMNRNCEKPALKNSFSPGQEDKIGHLKHPVKKGSIIYKFPENFMENEEIKDYCIKNSVSKEDFFEFSQDFAFISGFEAENKKKDEANVSFDGSPENLNRFEKSSEIPKRVDRQSDVKNMIYNINTQDKGNKYLKTFPYNPKSRPPYHRY